MPAISAIAVALCLFLGRPWVTTLKLGRNWVDFGSISAATLH
jgi:hypothetical protein